jgi:hypothetical protein
MVRIIQNAVKITENGVVTYLISANRNHYNRYTFDDGSFIAVDGGNDYIRRGFGGNLDDKTIECFNLSEKSPKKELTEKLLWGTLGKDRKGPLHYVPIHTLTQEHLKNILRDDLFGKFTYPLSKIHKSIIKSLIQ